MMDHSILPGFLESQAGQLGKHVNTQWPHSNLVHEARTRKVGLLNLTQGSAKPAERLHYSRSVLKRRFDPDVEIASGPRMSVQRQGVSPNHEETDLSGAQRGQ